MSLKQNIIGLSASLAISGCEPEVTYRIHESVPDIGTLTAIESGKLRRKLESCLNEGRPEEKRTIHVGHGSVEHGKNMAWQSSILGGVDSCENYNFFFNCGNQLIGKTESDQCTVTMSYLDHSKGPLLGECGYTKNGYFAMTVTCREKVPESPSSPLDQQTQAQGPSSPATQNVAVDYHNAESSNSANP